MAGGYVRLLPVLFALFVATAVPQIAQAAQGSGAARSAHAQPAGDARPAANVQAAEPSGSDASCPAASAAAAASATVSAPAGVRAIGGNGSATVVWCPPASGAGSVVSYTVTSSGGQQVTATVPNDWAIVDGLTDGTSYTFTVTANTASRHEPAPRPPRHRHPGPDRRRRADVLRGTAAAGQLRPVLAADRRQAGVHHGRRVRPVAYPVARRCGSMTCRR